MKGLCDFCQQIKDLITIHHRIAKKYCGKDNQENLLPNICGDCHKQLENGINHTRANLGAGKNISPIPSFNVGLVPAQLTAGSIYLNEEGKGYLNVGSPFYGMSCHNKQSGQKYIEASSINGSIVLITGSPNNSWAIYSTLE